MRHPGQVLTRDVLLERVWGYTYARATRAVDVHVRWLRRLRGRPRTPCADPDGARLRLSIRRDGTDHVLRALAAALLDAVCAFLGARVAARRRC
ncbi:MAG: helix-turn-helix domain-containing protein [Dehalococcoidia bacterium]